MIKQKREGYAETRSDARAEGVMSAVRLFKKSSV